jgi:hypothetical protein
MARDRSSSQIARSASTVALASRPGGGGPTHFRYTPCIVMSSSTGDSTPRSPDYGGARCNWRRALRPMPPSRSSERRSSRQRARRAISSMPRAHMDAGLELEIGFGGDFDRMWLSPADHSAIRPRRGSWSRPPRVRGGHAVHPFAKVAEPPRCAPTAMSSRLGLQQIGPNHSVFPDPVKSFPDERI